jgi:pyroglutamyl-peptidase
MKMSSSAIGSALSAARRQAPADDPVFQSNQWESQYLRCLLDARFRGHDDQGIREMSDRLRILVTGFGPFPGAPFNPTQSLVARLLRLRRPALSDVELFGHVFPVTYRNVDHELPELLASCRPHALLMFGLATRAAHVRIETRARNAVTLLWPDAGHVRPRRGSISGGIDGLMFGPHTAKLLRAAVGTGIDARASRNAGSYLCNYLSWRAIEASCRDDGPRLAAFVHIPLFPRGPSQQKNTTHRIAFEEMVDAGEAMLVEMVKLTRQAVRNSAHTERY